MVAVPPGAQTRAIVVDDDKIIRRYIMELLRDISGGSLELYEARDGVSALELLENKDIAIVLTDMRMGRMDGLSLIKESRKRWPWIQYIVLSNYDDFDYARGSFLFGAVNYVLKYQITRDLLRELLDAAVENIADYTKRRDYMEFQRRKSLTDEAVSLGFQVEKSLSDFTPPAFLNSSSWEQIAFARLDCLCRGEESADWRSALASQWACGLEGTSLAFPFILPGNSPRLSLGFLSPSNIKNAAAFRSAVALSLREFVDNVGKLGIVCAVAYDIMEHLNPALLAQVHGAAETVYYLDESTVIDRPNQKNDLFIQPDLITPFLNALLERRNADAALLVEETADKLRLLRPKPSVARSAMAQFQREMIRAGIPDAAEIPLLAQERLSTYAAALTALIRRAAGTPDTLPQDNSAIDLLISQLLANLSTPISLDEAALRVGFSRTHFSRLFKKATGESFNEFFTRKRIERACTLLQNPEAQLRAIAQSIGVSDVRYFRKLFEQHMHVSVGEWRRQKGCNEPSN